MKYIKINKLMFSYVVPLVQKEDSGTRVFGLVAVL